MILAALAALLVVAVLAAVGWLLGDRISRRR